MGRLVNIDCKGYGKIYKTVMRDRELPLLAKAVYAYFCSYARCGQQAYPKRDKIVRDLNINKDTYTKHLRWLIERGYITKERTATGNLYTIQQTVPAYRSSEPEDTESTDHLVCESVAARGFGTVPKLVMLDRNLTPQAKAIYAYFAAFAGAGTTSFPRRSTVLRELRIGSIGTYYRHFDLLVKYGYLSVEQCKENRRFHICIYRLNDTICSGMSEKEEHGTAKEPEGLPMSEKSKYSGKLLKTLAPSSEKEMSEKSVSEQSEYQNSGRNNNNSQMIINKLQEKEQEYNHQQDGIEMSQHAYTSAEVMEIINGDRLKEEFVSWGNLLRDTLGQLRTTEEERRYREITAEIFVELVNQLAEALSKVKNPDRIVEELQGSAFDAMIDGFMERWDNIRSVKGYVATAIKNFMQLCN